MRLRSLGTATAVILALTATLAAPAAMANWFEGGATPLTWQGSLLGEEHRMLLGTQGGTFNCKNVSFSGTTNLEFSRELVVSPELTKCAHITGYPDSWQMNGCKFRFRPGAGPALSGTADIVGCESPMQYKSFGTCRQEIDSQPLKGSVEYSNTSVGGIPALTISVKFKEITYTKTDTGACTEGPPGTYSNGTYIGSW